MDIDPKQFYNDMKREVALTLSNCLFGRKQKNLRADEKQKLSQIMRKLDEAFKEHGVDWKLTGDKE